MGVSLVTQHVMNKHLAKKTKLIAILAIERCILAGAKRRLAFSLTIK